MACRDVVGYDVSLSVAKSTDNHLDIIPKLKQIFKKWAFQLEQSDSGYLHWQIRGHLYAKRTEKAAIASFNPTLWSAGHWSMTSTGVHLKNNFNYVMKLDSRKEGPWTDQDPEAEDPPVLTRQLSTFMAHIGPDGANMYPWQKDLLSLVQKVDDRLITCIVDDSSGNNGKSVFSEYLEYKGYGYEIPPMSCMEDIMQACMGLRAQKCYLIDMPRAMKKEKLAGFYSGLEALKNGVMYDKRYAFKKRRIDRPQIVVFTNHYPERTLLSPDRWAIYRLVDFALERNV